jgi:hypothetical protein
MAFTFDKIVLFATVKVLPNPSGGEGTYFWKNSEEQSLAAVS